MTRLCAVMVMVMTYDDYVDSLWCWVVVVMHDGGVGYGGGVVQMEMGISDHGYYSGGYCWRSVVVVMYIVGQRK